MMYKTIALVANYSYIRQVETTMKSVLCHNDDIRFYLLNTDIPQEWFSIMNDHLRHLNSKIVDRKIDGGLLINEHISQPHLDPVAYAKFFIPEKVPSDIVVYLDSDIIVNDSIEPLFQLSFSNNEALAMAHEVENPSYNDGVIVFNNIKLRENKNLANDMLKLGKDNGLINGDQTVMNNYFKGKIKDLPSVYNFEIGMDRWAFAANRQDMIDKLNSVHNPKVIHYANDDKPWNQFSVGRLRQLWWYYYDLDWAEVGFLKMPEAKKNIFKKFKWSTFTLTDSQDIAHIERLIKALPEWHIQIAAFTPVGFELAKLSQYENVTVYPAVKKYKLEQLLSNSDVYLDINYYQKFTELVTGILSSDRPVFAFSSSKGDFEKYSNYHIISDSEVDKMVSALKEFESSKDLH